MNLAQSQDVATSIGNEPLWATLAKVLVIFGALVFMVLILMWAERRIVGRMQQRIGPNRVGPLGLAQGLADGIKLFLKEDIRPALADRPIYVLAPIVSAIPAFLAFSVIPFGPRVNVGGEDVQLQLADLPVGVLFILAMSSLGVYGIVLAGWASGSTYPLLGSLRSAAQIISYEVAMGLSFVGVFLYSGTLSTSGIVDAQRTRWYVVTVPVSFLVYAVAAVGETNRAPFDLPEAESELVAGFHTEYSSIKFAMFFLAEYINVITVSAVATTLFLGGWRPPPGLTQFDDGIFPVIWFMLKVSLFLFGFIWLRATLPRLRYDQFMQLGWKVLVPISLGWLAIVAVLKWLATIDPPDWFSKAALAAVFVLLVAAVFWPEGKKEEVST